MGEWGSVCDDEWDQQEADITCRYIDEITQSKKCVFVHNTLLGFPSFVPLADLLAWPRPSDRPTVLSLATHKRGSGWTISTATGQKRGCRIAGGWGWGRWRKRESEKGLIARTMSHSFLRFDGWGVHDCERTEAAGVREEQRNERNQIFLKLQHHSQVSCHEPLPPTPPPPPTTTPRPRQPIAGSHGHVEVR